MNEYLTTPQPEKQIAYWVSESGGTHPLCCILHKSQMSYSSPANQHTVSSVGEMHLSTNYTNFPVQNHSDI